MINNCKIFKQKIFKILMKKLPNKLLKGVINISE